MTYPWPKMNFNISIFEKIHMCMHIVKIKSGKTRRAD